MIIYKITNIQNQKIYIGQTINSLEDRWHRHCKDALNNVIDTHFARAIRLYGPESFVTEIIDSATSQEELTAKEQYWIQYYNSVQNGYNETDATYKSGGNTYAAKTPEEIAIVKERLSQSKLGGKNPNATGVKCKNINTKEEYHFASQSEIQAFFQESNHQFCSRRCRGEIKCLYKNEWLIAYENEDYPDNFTIKGQTAKRGNKVRFTDLQEHKSYEFNSFREMERELVSLGYSNKLPSRQILAEIAKGKRS
jgi:group I intron endonuclease